MFPLPIWYYELVKNVIKDTGTKRMQENSGSLLEGSLLSYEQDANNNMIK
jgi:hypothetical protein